MLPGENKGLGHQQIAKKHVGGIMTWQRLAVEKNLFAYESCLC